MNKDLLNAIHRYAEDREIDYVPAQYLGKAFGINFESQKDLIEWKQAIDRYLKTFDESDFSKVEETLEEMCGKKNDKKKEVKKV
jgi:hypothetical protein